MLFQSAYCVCHRRVPSLLYGTVPVARPSVVSAVVCLESDCTEHECAASAEVSPLRYSDAGYASALKGMLESDNGAI